MPHIFNLYKEIMNIDIGTIVIYTCKNSCNKGGKGYVEEYGFIQRSGEKIINLDDNGKLKEGYKPVDNIAKELEKVNVKEDQADEDGWVEVKKKKTKPKKGGDSNKNIENTENIENENINEKNDN